MANGKKRVATQQSKAVATVGDDQNMPAYVKEMGRTASGLQGLDSRDFILPRAVLLQALSRQVEAFEQAKVGKFWMTVIDQPLGDTLDIIVCSNKKRYLLLPPMGDSRGILARADDAKTWVPPEGEWTVQIKGVKQPQTWKITHPDVRRSGLAEFGSSIAGDPDSKPAATLFYDYLVYLPDYPDLSPCLLSLARSQGKKAKDLNGKIEFRGKAMQTQRFRVTPIKDRNADGQEFWNLAFAYNGWATDQEYAKCMAISERFKDYRAADEEEQAREEDTAGGPKDRGEL